MMIREGTGNLLEAQTDALVNTVNCVGVMGKGIALQFKKAYPPMFKDYKAACKADQVRPGAIHVWQTGLLQGPRFILNFPTKRHWRAKSRLDDIDAGLVALVSVIRQLDLSSIAIPPLGAGNGGLDWSVVRPRIEASLAPLHGVDILLWNPGPPPRHAERPVHTEPPRWTEARAAIIALMGQYRVLDELLTQVEVQKLAYFLQVSGFPMKLRYTRHHYGPYADQLYHLLQRLEGHFIHGLEDRNPAARLQLEHEAYLAAQQQVSQNAKLLECFHRVSQLIEGFETPYGMELLATVHWVAQERAPARVDPEAAIEGVRQWSARKRSTMRPSHIRKAWQRLYQQGWLQA